MCIREHIWLVAALEGLSHALGSPRAVALYAPRSRNLRDNEMSEKGTASIPL